MDKETEKRLLKDLVKLGDMIGDGLHLEPGGKWISRDYRKTMVALGFIPKNTRSTDSKRINEFMAGRVKDVSCQKCSGELRQTRSGSYRAACGSCGTTYQLGKSNRRK